MVEKMILEKILQGLSKKVENINIELKHMPRGELHMQKRGDADYYSLYTHSEKDGWNRKWITSSTDMLAKAIRKEYLHGERTLLENNRKLLEDLIDAWEPDCEKTVKNYLPKRCKRMDISKMTIWRDSNLFLPHPCNDKSIGRSPVRLTIPVDEIDTWANAPYLENRKRIEHKTHRAECGLLARSKSESHILDWYVHENYPFHYDESLQVGDTWIAPDFVFARQDGTMIFHEHWGMTDDAEYMKNNIFKLQIYARVGVVPGKNLIITVDEEDGSLDMRKATEIIKTYGR